MVVQCHGVVLRSITCTSNYKNDGTLHGMNGICGFVMIATIMLTTSYW